jgi:hypothetical protein
MAHGRVNAVAGVLGATAALGGAALPPCAGAACAACWSCVGAGAVAAVVLALGAAASSLRHRVRRPSPARHQGPSGAEGVDTNEAARGEEGGEEGPEPCGVR